MKIIKKSKQKVLARYRALWSRCIEAMKTSLNQLKFVSSQSSRPQKNHVDLTGPIGTNIELLFEEALFNRPEVIVIWSFKRHFAFVASAKRSHMQIDDAPSYWLFLQQGTIYTTLSSSNFFIMFYWKT